MTDIFALFGGFLNPYENFNEATFSLWIQNDNFFSANCNYAIDSATATKLVDSWVSTIADQFEL